MNPDTLADVLRVAFLAALWLGVSYLVLVRWPADEPADDDTWRGDDHDAAEWAERIQTALSHLGNGDADRCPQHRQRAVDCYLDNRGCEAGRQRPRESTPPRRAR